MTAVQPTTWPSSSATQAIPGSHLARSCSAVGSLVSKVALRVARPSS